MGFGDLSGGSAAGRIMKGETLTEGGEEGGSKQRLKIEQKASLSAAGLG